MLNFVIASGPKVGSTLLTRLVVQHPDVACMHESYMPALGDPSHILLDVAKYNAHGFPPEKREGWIKVYRESANQAVAIRAIMDEMIADLIARTGKRIGGDAWPFYGRHLPMMLSAYPELKIVHLVRDPRAAWNSAYQFYDRQQVGADNALSESITCDSFVETICEKQSAPVLTVRYEDLVSNPHEVMRDVWTFLGVDPSLGWIEFDETKTAYLKRFDWMERSLLTPDVTRLDAWRTEMADNDVKRITAGTMQFIKKHCYDQAAAGSLRPGDLITRFTEGASVADLLAFDPRAEDMLRREIGRMRKSLDIGISGLSRFIKATERHANALLEDRSTKTWAQWYTFGEGNGLARAMNNVAHILTLMVCVGLAAPKTQEPPVKEAA